MASIAAAYGFFWQTLWALPDNATLRELRCNPNVLLQGDEVVIPEAQPRFERCATGRKHVFRRKGVPSKLRLRLLDEDEPRRGEPYALEVDGRVISSGAVPDDGLVEAFIPPGARGGSLVVGEGEDAIEYALHLGNLDPVSTVTGVQARLLNLGYPVAAITGTLDDATQAAIAAFQKSHELEVSGTADAATQQKLEQLHGC